MFSSLYQIAKNTFRETLREPIYLLVLLAALVLIGTFPLMTLFVFREQIKLVIDSAMATMMVFGWLLAVLSSSHAIAREIENGTALLLLSKPVKRPVFILAKILGILAALTVFCFLAFLASLIAVRVAKDQFRFDHTVMALYFGALVVSFAAAALHNYVSRSSFPMAAVLAMLVFLPLAFVIAYFIPAGEGEERRLVGYAWEMVPALLLITYSVWAMGTLATALSTRLSLAPNFLACSVIFVVGLMSDYLIGRHVYEEWIDTPAPAGRATLWISYYSFTPAERMSVGQWSKPAALGAAGSPFTVWCEGQPTGELPDLGEQPEEAWRDNAGWKRQLSDLANPPRLMAQYDPYSRRWSETLVMGEGVAARRDGKDFASVVFRRSNHQPRTPVGGTYSQPFPEGGSRLASVLYACIPNWQLFWMADALAAEKRVPGAYLALGGMYVLLLVGFFGLVAVVLFWNREIGGQMRV
ncbi:MAG: ABC transporter permease [Lentisphaeria bacterium]|nr:ABC transporter permease [Lentisphaeria bacterium]